jgi:hypothetical protein
LHAAVAAAYGSDAAVIQHLTVSTRQTTAGQHSTAQQALTAVRGRGGAVGGGGQAFATLLAAGSVGAHIVGGDIAQRTRQGHLAIAALVDMRP